MIRRKKSGVERVHLTPKRGRIKLWQPMEYRVEESWGCEKSSTYPTGFIHVQEANLNCLVLLVNMFVPIQIDF